MTEVNVPVEEKEPVEAQEEKKEKKKEEEPTDVLAKALEEFPGAPDQTAIEGWKQQHGDVFCSGFSETEIYVWRSITRAEFSALQVKSSQEDIDAEMEAVQTCLLWSTPRGQDSMFSKAGTLTTLHEQVLQNSNFVDPRMASTLVFKL